MTPHPPYAPTILRRSILPLCVLAYLWFALVNQLRVEWAVNPQYHYGWAVPLLCAWLIWKRWQQPSNAAQPVPRNADHGTPGTQPEPRAPDNGPRTPDSGPLLSPVSHSSASLFRPLFVCLALAWLPTRLIQEANPEWRLISWALAIEVVGLTLLIWDLRADSRKPGTLRTSQLAFPLLFFLIAVPWPTKIEAPLVQFLTRANAATAVEFVGWFGLPALRRGNVIEVGTGMVGIDDACSGIRSFQATLMIALFLGELYRHSFRRRLWLLLGGCALAYVFNVARTSLLVWIASGKGVAAMSAWHDPTGVTILVAGFICLWIAALLMGREHRSDVKGQPSGAGSQTSEVRGQRSEIRGQRRWLPALAAWLLLADVGTEAWYRFHESILPKTVSWRVELPRDNPNFQAVPFSDEARQFLRYDEGLNGVWMDEGAKLQAIFLRWNPGRIAPHLAKSHTPEVCLTAAGRELVSQSDLREFTVRGLRLPFRSYVVNGDTGLIHVFYCLWEDRANGQFFNTTSLSLGNRLGPVMAGRRNSGQRSLEIAIWGANDSTEAERVLARELEKLIQVDESK